MDASANIPPIAGSISFSPLVVGAGVGSPSGGLNFDIPLASIQALSNNALAFTANSNAVDLGFMSNVLKTSAATVDAASQRSAGINLAAINAGYAIGAGNTNLASQIAGEATSTAQLQINQQASVAKYLSDNAARTAQYSVQQTTQQVQVTQAASTKKSLISRIFGGIFG